MKKIKNLWFYIGAFFIYVFLTTAVSVIAAVFLTKPVYGFLVKNFSPLNVGVSNDTILVIIDDITAEKYTWPWSSEQYTALLDYFHTYAKPKIVGLDTCITSFNTKNKNNLKLLNVMQNMKTLVTGFSPAAESDEGKSFFDTFQTNQALDVEIVSKDDYPRPFYGITNVSEYLASKKINYGSVYIKEDITTGQVYNQEYIVRIGDKFYPSLSLKMYLMAYNTNKIVLDQDKIIIPETGLTIPINYYPDYNSGDIAKSLITTPIWYYQNFANSSYSHISISAFRLLRTYYALQEGITPQTNPELYDIQNNPEDALYNPELFKDKIIFIGVNISGPNNDVLKTPMHERHPGVDIQATSFDNLRYGDFLHKNIYMFLIDMVFFAILSLLVFVVVMKTDVFKGLLSIIGINIIYFILLAGLTICGYITNPVFPVCAEIVTLIFGYSFKFISENRNKEKIKQAMGKYLSQDIMKNVVSNIDDLKLGGKRAIVTVLFSDIRGFTSMSEKMSAEDVTKILNEYFTEMEPIITKYNGVINKFIGDAVMAIFGEPIQDMNHPANAVRCAYEMLKKVEYLREKWLHEGKPKIEIGIGICTGEVFIGNIGSETRMEYTVIGDTVNLASRIESFNKVYKTNLLVSSSTYSYIADAADVIKINDVKIRGKAQKMDIYEVLRIEKPHNKE